MDLGAGMETGSGGLFSLYTGEHSDGSYGTTLELDGGSEGKGGNAFLAAGGAQNGGEGAQLMMDGSIDNGGGADGGMARLVAGNSDDNVSGGDLTLYPGSSGGGGGYAELKAGDVYFGLGGLGAYLQMEGAAALGTGGSARIYGGDAGSGTEANGGDIELSPGPGDGVGRAGQILMPEIPAVDPVVTSAIWADNGVLVLSGFTAAALSTRQVSADLTFPLSDRGRLLVHPAADATVRTWEIPSEAAAPFPVGTAITIYNQGGANVRITRTPPTKLVLAGGGEMTRVRITPFAQALLVKVDVDYWVISGFGLVGIP
jgi:hypothetical protein